MLIEWCIQFGPIVAFFFVFEGSHENFFAATAVLMAAIVLATVMSLVRSHSLPWFPIWTALFVLTFGGATLYYHDPSWLILKDTLYDGLFGFVILVGLAFRKNLLRKFFTPLFAISDHAWHVLSVRWAIFFLLSAGTNEIVRRHFSPEFWVHYKIVNTIAFILFGFSQFRLTASERIVDEANRLGLRLKRNRPSKPSIDKAL